MFCAKCGAKSSDDDVFCIDCGAALRRREEVQFAQTQVRGAALAEGSPVSENQSKSTKNIALDDSLSLISGPGEESDEERKKPISGWLRWFCIQLCVIGPLFDLAACLNNPTPIVIAFACILTAFRIYVAISIFKISAKALRNVRLYFIVVFLIAMFDLGLAAILNGEPQYDKDVQDLYREAFRALFSTVVWASYFNRSVRVRNTFGRNL